MRRERITRTLLGAALSLAAVALPLSVAAQDATPVPLEAMTGMNAAWATLMDVDGNEVGQVAVTGLDETTVFLQVSAENLPPGFHGFHVHTTGVCDPTGDSPFSSAGGHLNMDETGHREHGGDLPVLYVTATGMAQMAVVTERFTVDQLLDEDGGAIVVHANPDNYANVPERYGGPDEETLKAGDAGPRIACGVFTGDMQMTAPEAMETEEAAG